MIAIIRDIVESFSKVAYKSKMQLFYFMWNELTDSQVMPDKWQVGRKSFTLEDIMDFHQNPRLHSVWVKGFLQPCLNQSSMQRLYTR